MGLFFLSIIAKLKKFQSKLNGYVRIRDGSKVNNLSLWATTYLAQLVRSLLYNR